MHPKFDPTGFRTHDLQTMTVHFMSLTCPSKPILTSGAACMALLDHTCTYSQKIRLAICRHQTGCSLFWGPVSDLLISYHGKELHHDVIEYPCYVRKCRNSSSRWQSIYPSSTLTNVNMARWLLKTHLYLFWWMKRNLVKQYCKYT